MRCSVVAPALWPCLDEASILHTHSAVAAEIIWKHGLPFATPPSTLNVAPPAMDANRAAVNTTAAIAADPLAVSISPTEGVGQDEHHTMNLVQMLGSQFVWGLSTSAELSLPNHGCLVTVLFFPAVLFQIQQNDCEE